jgi:hypothetical protein
MPVQHLYFSSVIATLHPLFYAVYLRALLAAQRGQLTVQA